MSAPSPTEAASIKLFVGGLQPSHTATSVKTYFETFGPIDEVVVKAHRSPSNAAFCFLFTRDREAADKILASTHTIDGHHVPKPEKARTTCHRAAKSTAAAHVPSVELDTRRDHGGSPLKVFVGGLPSRVTEDIFKDYFGRYGSITDAVIMVDHYTKRPRGFGFVTYADAASVDALLSEGRFLELDGHEVEVKLAVPRAQMLNSVTEGMSSCSIDSPASEPYEAGYGRMPYMMMYGGQMAAPVPTGVPVHPGMIPSEYVPTGPGMLPVMAFKAGPYEYASSPPPPPPPSAPHGGMAIPAVVPQYGVAADQLAILPQGTLLPSGAAYVPAGPGFAPVTVPAQQFPPYVMQPPMQYVPAGMVAPVQPYMESAWPPSTVYAPSPATMYVVRP